MASDKEGKMRCDGESGHAMKTRKAVEEKERLMKEHGRHGEDTFGFIIDSSYHHCPRWCANCRVTHYTRQRYLFMSTNMHSCFVCVCVCVCLCLSVCVRVCMCMYACIYIDVT